MPQVLSGRTAVTGIGWSEFSRASPSSVLGLGTEAALAATMDAGLTTADLDGVVTYFHNEDTIAPRQLVRALGMTRCNYQMLSALGGGWSCAAVATASMAIYSGLCRHVLVFRAMKGRSEPSAPPKIAAAEAQWRTPFGVSHAAARFGPHVRAYMHRYGTTSIDFAHVAVTQRRHAGLNRKAMLTAPLTVDEHQSSPMLIDPFRLLDCCLRSDGAVALVVSAADRAKDCRHAPVFVSGVMGGTLGTQHGTLTTAGLSDLNAGIVAPRLYEAAGIGPSDIDIAELYDPFTGLCLMHMEGFALAEPGGAGDMFRSGATGLDGRLPTNTHGGLLSEAYTHGLGHVVEAVQQLRPGGVVDDGCPSGHDFDREHCRQVRNPTTALVCGECGDSSLVLRADR